MMYTHLGRSGLSVSKLCLGTMNFGPHTEETEAHSIMDQAHDAGLNFFDTANAYGGTGARGWTEEIIGRWIAQGGGRRERTVLATKVYGNMARLAQRRQAVRPEHPPGPGCQPEAAANGPHRPVPIPPCGQGHALG